MLQLTKAGAVFDVNIYLDLPLAVHYKTRERLNVQMCGQTAVWTQPLDSVHILLVSHVEVWEGQHDWDVKVVH